MKACALTLCALLAGCGDPVDTAAPMPDAPELATDAAPPPPRPPAAPTAPGCVEVRYEPTGTQPADLCIPAGVRTDLAVLLVHGGGGVQGTRRALRPWQNRFIAAGHVVLNIDYTLVDAQTPSPVFPRVEREVKAAAQYLRHNAAALGIDPDRIVLLGTSAGARLGGVIATTGDDPWFAGEGRWDDLSDRVNGLIGFYGGYTGRLSGVGVTEDQYYGGPPTSADPAVQARWSKADAVGHAGAAAGPVLLFHGALDDIAPPQQSRRMYEALTGAGVDASLVIVPEVGHSFDRDGAVLTPAGEESAREVLAWLATRFPAP